MNQKTMIIGAVVILFLIAGIFYVINTQSSEGWTENWLPEGETNQGINGEWFIDTYLVYENGERESLKTQAESLWMEGPSGNQVVTIDYVIKAQATRDEHQGTFDSVEIDISNLKLNVRFNPLLEPTKWMDVWKDSFSSVTLLFDGSSQTGVEEVATFSIPVGIDDSEGFDGFPLATLPCSTMNDMTANWQTGTWNVEYSASGSIQFRGINADYGDGDWQDAALPGSVSHGVTIGGNEVNMDWSTEVTYN